MKYFFVLLIVLYSCGTAKKVEKIETAISKKDTTALVVVDRADSAEIVRNLLGKIKSNAVSFNTFSAKIRLDYQDKDGGDQATAFVRMQKDSLIWISLTGALGIEGFRVLVTTDSVVVWNKLKKTVQYRTIEYLSALTDIPFNFYTLQNFIVGNPVFLDSNVISYRTKEKETQLLTASAFFKHLLTLENENYLIVHSKLDDNDPARNRTMGIALSDYEWTPNGWFAKQRNVTLAENNRLDINLNFKQFVFDSPLSFPFNLPKNVKVK